MTAFTHLGDRYDVGQVIGRGGMAEVYEGTDRRLNRRVAIKVLRPDLARDPMFQERFRREAQSAAGLNHPNIVAIYDTGEDLIGEGAAQVSVPYIVMEFVDGDTLRHTLNNGPRILPERALEVIAGVLAALDYAHRHGIVHRDIKPANIMINTNGDSKVMDFGIARAMSDAATSVTATSSTSGSATVAFTAPVSNGGSAITGYRITSSPAGATCVVGANATTYTCTGLTDGTAYTFGVAISTVAGRFIMVFHCGVGFQTSLTALQTSTANSSSVPV